MLEHRPLETEAYQRKMNRARMRGDWAGYALCKAARDAADRIALKIKWGRIKGRSFKP
jgi:hypothetical protein